MLISYEMLYNETTKSSPLNTTTVGTYVKQILDRYGKEKPIDLNCTSARTPKISFTKGDTSGQLAAECLFIVRNSSDLNETAFNALIDFTSKLDISLDKGVIKAKLKDINFNEIKITESKIGDINGESIKGLLNLISTVIVEAINNQLFAKGITIPSISGISFNDTDINIFDGYVKFGMNPIFENTTFNFEPMSYNTVFTQNYHTELEDFALKFLSK